MDEELARRKRNEIIHTIGNLTLVNQKLNSSLSNSAWGVKRDALLGHSVMNMNGDLASRSDWDEDSIRERSGEIAKLVAEHWPGPNSLKWD